MSKRRSSIRSTRRRIGKPKQRNHKKLCQVTDGDILPSEPYMVVEEEHYDSDAFFKNCLSVLCAKDDTDEYKTDEADRELSDVADAYYIVLDRVYEDFSDPAANAARYERLKTDCKSELQEHKGFCCLSTSSYVRYIQCYEMNSFPVIKTCVTVDRSFSVDVSVHGKPVPRNHKIWDSIPPLCFTKEQIMLTLAVLSNYSVCPGNPDKQFQNLVPSGSYLDVSKEGHRAGYQEVIAIPTVRATKCVLLVQNDLRCKCCCTYRRTLTKALWRRKERVPTPKRNWVNSTVSNKVMSASQKTAKLSQLRQYAKTLKTENSKLQKELKGYIKEHGVILCDKDCGEITELMQETEQKIRASYPDDNSIQRLFWEQQLKQSKLKNKKSMKWHPMIIKWCIYLKSKSASTYDSLRKTGFINLPSERTLHDYTNVLSKGVGYKEDVICHLQQEVKHHTEEHQNIVGILQDEVRIKSDLVYNKHTGELIGFVDLDNVGNDLNHMDLCLKKEEKSLAKYVLVIMVQGLSTKLKYPLAHFATNGVVSDQLFTILWEAVEILEVDVGLSVLFITSDGASPNRRFIKLHGQGDGTVYRAQNIFAAEKRYIYFISDPPHLIKTTRNNFSNSFAHKKSKTLWKSGQDISWMTIIKLFEETCSGVYKLCPKLTRKHLDLKSFNYMKVNLAAQVLSRTVGNAIQHKYGTQYSETVRFILHMNNFFDIMNTRNFSESVRKRNALLMPFTSIHDDRLRYLNEEFLGYFEEWEREVEERPGNFSKSKKNMMKLSYQTTEGMKITVKSITECVQYCLNHGMPFVLTEKFNQDPIEQHFGMHRASCGYNTNPTLQQFNSSIQKLRVVGSQALAPLRGNTKRQLDIQRDDTPLNKRRR